MGHGARVAIASSTLTHLTLTLTSQVGTRGSGGVCIEGKGRLLLKRYITIDTYRSISML